MSDLYKNKYRISSARLKNWNYANEAMYFITICSKNMECFLGEIVEKNDNVTYGLGPKSNNHKHLLKLTEIGEIAKLEWYKSIELRPDMNILLDEFIVMPNHIHGIICLGKNEFNSDFDRRDAMHGVSTNGVSSKSDYKNQFGPQSKNISSIIRGYKSAVTTFARKQNQYFEWQPRFHEHIIRSTSEYYKISNYIISNPATWINDKFNPKNILLTQ